MNYLVKWMNQHRWFKTKAEAIDYAQKSIDQWLTGGGRSPEYKVIYNPSGVVVWRYDADRN